MPLPSIVCLKRGAREQPYDKQTYMLSPFGLETPFLLLSNSLYDINYVCLYSFKDSVLSKEKYEIYNDLNEKFNDTFKKIDISDREIIS